MGLQAQAPLRVLHAVLDGLFGVGQAGGAVHGLQEEVLEVQVFEARGQGVGLGVDQLEFVAAFDDDRRGAFGADADPVDAGRRLDGAVGFDGDGEAARVDDGEQGRVELQQGFAAGEDDVAVGGVGAPGGFDGVGEPFGGGEFAAAVAVGADEVGVAEGAGGAGAAGKPPR